MTNYLIYQLPFEHKNKRDMSFFDAKQIEEISDEYELVAQVTARSLDECFRIGNFVCEEDQTLIKVVGKMHSLSVGDIVVDLNANTEYVCASFGWEEIEMKECV